MTVHVRNRLSAAKRLIGRTIAKVDLGTFARDRGCQLSTRPVLTLDDGSQVRFVVEETDSGDGYGVALYVDPAP